MQGRQSATLRNTQSATLPADGVKVTVGMRERLLVLVVCACAVDVVLRDNDGFLGHLETFFEGYGAVYLKFQFLSPSILSSGRMRLQRHP